MSDRIHAKAQHQQYLTGYPAAVEAEHSSHLTVMFSPSLITEPPQTVPTTICAHFPWTSLALRPGTNYKFTSYIYFPQIINLI
ncbi:hypothetical protein FRX31_032091 [Thalictrum thalictroides]|uniref:Uncharacterized protein n=1 Tax=Thalictrum thalictroides TaxID=46969 RepID=A0A7J6V076_THATH|nr:hypothetical protein FRX31_032091 [Thalictrum thalictroides]